MAMTGMGRQFGVVLQPLGDLQAGDFRQLDIHQDQVGPVLARQADRLHAALGLNGGVAVSFEQVVEELHVQLIVFNDQNRFLHMPRHARSGPNPSRPL